MGPKTTPSLISKGGREIDNPWEIGLRLNKNLASCKDDHWASGVVARWFDGEPESNAHLS